MTKILQILELLLNLWTKVKSKQSSGTEVRNYLSKKQIDKVRLNLDEYKWAVGYYPDIPWQALASIHYRESEFNRETKIPGGVFQLDPGGDKTQFSSRVENYVRAICESKKVAYAPIEKDFRIACLVAVNELSTKIRGILKHPNGEYDMNALADMFWGYNGRSAWHTPDGLKDKARSSYLYSPYVSNSPHMGRFFKLKGTMLNEKGERVPVDIEDTRPGAMPIYLELVRRTSEIMV